MFKLLRYFSLTSAVAILSVTVALVMVYRHNAVKDLVGIAEAQNVALGRSFANTIWPRFSAYVTGVSDLDGDALRARPETEEIHEVLKKIAAGLPVLKVKIYNLDGLTVFSSQASQIGADKSNNLGFLASARDGKPASKLVHKGKFSTFDGGVFDRDLVESYLPIRRGDGPVEGVFELYSDVTPLIANIERSTTRLAAGLLLIFGLLYLVLFLIVRRADRILKRQYVDLLRGEQALQEANERLEQRVEERTATLTREMAERERAEKKIRDLANFPEHNPEPVLRFAADGTLSYANPASARVLKELACGIGEPAPEDWRRMFAQVRETEASREFEYECGDRTLSFLISPVPEIGYVIVRGRDITERKQAEVALRASEKRIRTLLDKSSQGILVHRNHDMLYVNQTLVEMFGYDSADEILALESRGALTAPEEQDRLLGYHQARLRGEPAPLDYEYKGQRKDGSHLWLENRSFWIEWEDGPAICTTLFDITERKQAEMALRESEERFRAVVDNSPTKIHIKDLDGRYTLINRQSEILFGVTNEEARGKTSRDIFPKEVADSFAGHDQAVIESGQTIENEEEWVCDDGVHTYLTVKFPILGATGEIVAVGAIGTDITERKRAEEAQRRSEERLRGAVESLQEGFGLFDADDRLVLINDEYRRINPSAQEILDRGLRYEDLLRANVKRGMIVEAVGREEEFIRERVQQHRNPKDPILRQFANGVWYLIKETRTPEGGTALTFIDITKQKQVEEQIRRQANYDSLTGLPNRMLFLDRLKQAIVSVRRNNGLLALLFIDLDRFKVVNDTLGHVVGDRLLQEAAERLQASVREVDTVARLGGDEFTIILQDIAKAEDAAMVANKVIDSLGKPFLLDGHEAFIGASIGITIFPADGDNTTTLLRNADVAMYRAKDAGRNEHQFFTKAMDAQALNRMSLENDLRYALERKQLFVHYQPIVEFQSGRVINAEALLRWRHPTRGLVAPDEFIPLAEETGLIKSLGEWVLRTACAQAQAWRDMDLPVFGVSVNLSSGQLKRGFSRDTVATVLEETGLSPDLLTFEITESLIMEDAEEAIAYLHAIREMGVGLSIDDFGTGYSSLSYLKRLPVNSVKIDRSFVHDVTVDPEDASLADAIIALAHNLGLKVIAEGVETKEQLDFLRSRGCDLYQGYYFAKPMTAKEFQNGMRTGQWSRPAKKKASSVRAAKRRKPATGDPRRASRGAGIR